MVGVRWDAAGTMHLAHVAPHLLLLGDGRAMAVGSEGSTSSYYGETVVETSRVTELWDPVDGMWRETEPLNKPRGGFAALTLQDGRILVAGGMNPELQSYSSAYIFDPATDQWSKTGLMNTARSEPAAALLPDGRVLLAGGRYSAGAGDYPWAGSDTATLAAYQVSTGGDAAGATVPVDDMDPGPVGHALATAEIYDPGSGTWSATGSMRYARVGAQAVTLGDGRVLVWGSPFLGGRGAATSGEIYDPRTGSFEPAPPVPAATDDAALSLGVPVERVTRSGTIDPYGAELVRLANGDALLIRIWTDLGRVYVQQAVRFDASRGAWRPSGEPYAATQYWEADTSGKHWGTRHPDGIVVALPDGRVLFAGGSRGRTAELYDPRSETWSSLPRMPAARAAGRGLVLDDGSVLVVPSGSYTDAFRLVLRP